MKCHRCKQEKNKADLVGINVFDATTGMHITTRWYCFFCAKSIGIMSEVVKQ
jgi:hypothetical protein